MSFQAKPGFYSSQNFCCCHFGRVDVYVCLYALMRDKRRCLYMFLCEMRTQLRISMPIQLNILSVLRLYIAHKTFAPELCLQTWKLNYRVPFAMLLRVLNDRELSVCVFLVLFCLKTKWARNDVAENVCMRSRIRWMMRMNQWVAKIIRYTQIHTPTPIRYKSQSSQHGENHRIQHKSGCVVQFKLNI